MAIFECCVTRIRAIEPIENADAIELAVIGDYRSVVKKGEFRSNDLAVYIPEGSLVPQWLLKQMNLEGRLAGSNHDRVKAAKFRGCLSQGLVYPLIDQKRIEYFNNVSGQIERFTVHQGDDVKDMLGVKKWEPEIPANFAGELANYGQRLTVAYDVENLKKYPDVLHEGEEVVMTEKLHGCLTGDSLVMLPNGEQITIERVVNDQNITHVLSFDIETQSYVPKRITGRMKRQNTEHKTWIRLNLENGRSLTLTEDHPVYSRDRKQYVFAKDILPNEDIESVVL